VEQQLPAGAQVQDLGEHRLKDLRRPSRLFQLTGTGLPIDFPPLKTLDTHPNNLPIEPTLFIGREQEVATLCRLLSRPDARLVTLTGPGGIGKTRLGLHVAAELADHFADGVFLVPLASARDPEQVLPAIAQTLAIGEASDQPLLALLKTALKEKQLLLLLDNFEQVDVAALAVAEVLASCPRLKVLVTSRSVLHVRAEREFVVPPLSLPVLKHLPSLSALSQYEAVALFIERAQAVKPEFQVTNSNAPAVAAICTRLDGLPLAIELAAARVKYFPPQTLLTRLEQGLAVLVGGARDLPLRQQTLRGAMAWSYDLLSPEQKPLFRRCAVFVDGCTWEAAEQVCTVAGPLQADILEGLVSLVDKSLLRQAEPAEGGERFWMLQMLREFGLEMLSSAGETEATLQAHASYYLALAEEAEPHLRGTGQDRWIPRLEQEHENLRAALTFLLEQAHRSGGQEENAQAEQALRLCGALYWFWYTHGHVREGQTFMERALVVREGVEALVRARVLFASGELAFALDHYERAAALGRESLALYRELADTRGIAASLSLLGFITWTQSQFALARVQYEEASTLFQQVGDTWQVVRCRTQIARICTVQGEYERATALLEESLGRYRALGDQERFCWTLYLLARVLFLSQQDLARAATLAEQSLALMKEVGNITFEGHPLDLLGQIRLVQGERLQARELAEKSVALHKELGDRADNLEALIDLGRVVALSGDLVMARHLYEESLALMRELDFQEFLAACLEGVAAVEAAQGEPVWAARLWGTAEVLREAMGTPRPPVYRADYEQAVAAACRELGEEVFAAAWAQGRATPLEQVIDEVLKT
jgi:predicted ATPase